MVQGRLKNRKVKKARVKGELILHFATGPRHIDDLICDQGILERSLRTKHEDPISHFRFARFG